MIIIIKKISSNATLDQIYDLVNTSFIEDFPMYKQQTVHAYRTQIFTKEYFHRFLLEKSNQIFGAFIESEFVGFVTVKPDYGGVMYLEWLMVHKTYRNQGIGSRLLKKAEQWGLQNNIHCVFLYTESNENIEFYKKREYKLIGKLDNFWFGENEYLLVKHLFNT